MDCREIKHDRKDTENKIKQNDEVTLKQSQSMVSVATIDSGVGTISSAESIQSLDSVVSVQSCVKDDVSHTDRKETPTKTGTSQMPPNDNKILGKFSDFIALEIIFLLRNVENIETMWRK